MDLLMIFECLIMLWMFLKSKTFIIDWNLINKVFWFE